MTEQILPYGSTLQVDDGRVISLTDRRGTIWASARWDERRLVQGSLRLPDGSDIGFRTNAMSHPILGLCDVVTVKHAIRTRFMAVDWAKPLFIPGMDAPGRLPPGAGTAILNFLAYQAQGRLLRYLGPYPTAALFDTLCGCFRVEGDPAAALIEFIESAEETALSGAKLEVPVDFRPHPVEFLECGPACLVLRDGVERIVLDGRSYYAHQSGSRRVRLEGSEAVAYVEIGGEPWVDRIRVRADGQLVEGPFDLPAFDHPVNGDDLPQAMIDLVNAEIATGAPALLQAPLAQIQGGLKWIFGDAGDENVACRDQSLVVHSLLLDRLAPRSPERFLATLVDGARPHLLRMAQQRLLAGLKGSGGV